MSMLSKRFLKILFYLLLQLIIIANYLESCVLYMVQDLDLTYE